MAALEVGSAVGRWADSCPPHALAWQGDVDNPAEHLDQKRWCGGLKMCL